MLRLLPPDLDLDRHLAAHPPTFSRFHSDELVHLLHLVSAIPATNRKMAEKLDLQLGYVHLSSTRLREWLPNYHEYLQYAVDTNLLETDNHFVVPRDGDVGKCRGYRFAARFRKGWDVPLVDGPSCRIVWLKDAAVMRRLNRVRLKQSKLTKQIRQDYSHLLEWLDPKTTPLRIRQEEALRFIAQERDRVRRDPSLRKPKRKPGPNGEVVFKDPEEQYDQRFTSVAKLVERDLNTVLDAKVGRLHTTLTNMSGKLRPFVYAEGYGQLVAIDLKNSQPFLANLLLNPSFYSPFTKGRKGGRVPLTLQKEGLKVWEEMKKRKNKHSYITLLRIVQRTGNDDIEKFREWTASGEFYTNVQQALNSQGEQVPFERDDIKVMLFEVLFSRNSTKSMAKTAFAELFPTVAKVFRTLKVKDHSILPRLLQLLEAHLFLRVITKRIHQRCPHIPLFTVHDSVVTPVEYADYVERIMKQELTKWVGQSPQFTRSFWGTDSA
ncbi:hypothetical protein GCM10011375_40710 [Hymenobacter qilianensis]|uniref:Uncharacterized protein n=1 Tax=Hymenobacter qilianensis TaxID=1385715 RepID=A0ACB5PXF6_9BACT|nr:hypothetical protein [Hymenobacter qilianensis]GGF81610.1 hypothetical protein GCM10011375_40710 [Hymenobacter qilianensis]